MSNRRTAIKQMVTAGAMVAASGTLPLQAIAEQKRISLKGNINHSVCRWTYNFLSLDQLCQEAKKIGIKAIDLVGPNDWPTLKQYGLHSSMCNGAEISLTEGWNNTTYHQQLTKNYLELIPIVAKAGYTNLICFSGNRNGMNDETGLKNAVSGLKQILATAEKHKVNVVMELLNSKIDHKDYMADRTTWGVELCKRLDSENFGLLYDIYHMQIDEGDVIRTIQTAHHYIKHYHTAGVPGRHEPDNTQELNYPAIMNAILKTGFKGYVAQEFIPQKQDKIASLREAVQLCDV